MALTGMTWNPQTRKWQTQPGVGGGGGQTAYQSPNAAQPFQQQAAGAYNPFTATAGGATTAAFPGSTARAQPSRQQLQGMMRDPMSMMQYQWGANEEARNRTQQGMYRAESALGGVQQRQEANPLNAQLQTSVSNSLAQPYSLSPEIQAAMIQRTQDRLNTERDTSRGALSAQMANRGLSSSSNYVEGFGGIEKSYADALANASRDVEIQAALQAGQEQRAAQQQAQGLQGQQFGQDITLASTLANLLGSYQYQPEDYMSPMMAMASLRKPTTTISGPSVAQLNAQARRFY